MKLTTWIADILTFVVLIVIIVGIFAPAKYDHLMAQVFGWTLIVYLITRDVSVSFMSRFIVAVVEGEDEKVEPDGQTET